MPGDKADHNRSRECARTEAVELEASMKSSAYIGVAALLAMFIVAFATAPKARPHSNGHWIVAPMASPYDEIRRLQLALFPRRS